MEDDNINSGTVSGGVEFPSSDVDESVSPEESASKTAEAPSNFNGMSLQEMNDYLGKNYPSKEAALKSIKDTFSYVGKKKESVVKEALDEDRYISREQYEKDMFFSKNPDYSSDSVKKVLESISKAEGISITDASQTEAFKEVFGAVKGFSESQNLKTVLESNPRIASTKNNLSKAKEAIRNGDPETARSLATKAVLEAYQN